MSFLFKRKPDASPKSGDEQQQQPPPQGSPPPVMMQTTPSPPPSLPQPISPSNYRQNQPRSPMNQQKQRISSFAQDNGDNSAESSSTSSTHMPTFHESYTPSSRNSHTGSFSSAGPIAAMLKSSSIASEENTSMTPLERNELVRQSSSSSTGSTGSASNSGFLPPLGYGVLGKQAVTASGSLHHIYQTNVLMTPTSSLPSTPNSHANYVPSSPGATVPAGILEFGTAVTTKPAPLSLPSLHTSSLSSAIPPHPKTSSNPTTPTLQTQQQQPEPQAHFPPDEVSLLRAMFQRLTLTRSTFQLGDTLGTGTFGRVRIVSYQPTASSSTSSSNTTVASPALAKLQYYALKMLKKSEIIRLKQVEHIKAEKAILSRITHPFIVHLYASFQDERYLYMTMEYVIGGELFSQLRKVGRFSNETSKFYSAEIILALQYLHAQSIVYRDLKPENLLIDKDGHIKITDFGFAKVVEDRTWTLCGTPEYLAPEIIQSRGHNKAVDWWALGILLFEMLAGYPPFYDENPFGIYQKILKGTIDFPKHIDSNAKDLIKKLLTADRTKRFGCLQHGAEDIKQHPWFKGLDWRKVYERKYKPPFVPAYRAPNDTSNFDRYPDSRESSTAVPLNEKERSLFADF